MIDQLWNNEKIEDRADYHSAGRYISTETERLIANKIRLALREMKEDYESELTRLRRKIDELETENLDLVTGDYAKSPSPKSSRPAIIKVNHKEQECTT